MTGCVKQTPAQAAATQATINNLATQANTAVTNSRAGIVSGMTDILVKLNAKNPVVVRDFAVASQAAAMGAAASFSGQVLPTGAQAQVILSNLFPNVPAEVGPEIGILTNGIQLFATLPTGNTIVSPQVAAFIVNLCNDLSAADAAFLAQPVIAPPSPPPATPTPSAIPTIIAPAVGGGVSVETKLLQHYGVRPD